MNRAEYDGFDGCDGFDGFVRARAAALLRFGHLLTGDPRAADRLVQEALERTGLRWSRLAGHGEPEQYARRHMVAAYLSGSRRRRDALAPTAAEPPYQQAAHHDEVLWSVLANLLPRQRAVLVLRYHEGLPEAEIAQRLGCSRGTVQREAGDGLTTLRDVLAHKGESDIDELERRLHRLLVDDRLALAGAPDLLTRVHARMRRRRRDTLRTVVVALAVIGLGGTAAVLARGSQAGPAAPPAISRTPTSAAGSAPAAGPAFDVAWVDRPAPVTPPLPAPVAVRPRPTDARRCAPSDVAVGVEAANGRGGHDVTVLRFTNTSRSTCVLDGYPEVRAVRPGAPDVRATHGIFFESVEANSANMAPGATTYLVVETDFNCDARFAGGTEAPAAIYHRLLFTLPGGFVAVDDVDVDVLCGLGVGRFVVPERDRIRYAPNPISRLAVRMELPTTAAPGTTLTYVVTLTAPADAPITLAPCPGYRESTSAGLSYEYALNCDTVRSFAPGGTVRYEMRLPVPADTAPGRFTVSWDLLLAGGTTHAAGTTSIVAP